MGHLEFFRFDETLNTFSYRADTSISVTFGTMSVVDPKPGAYLIPGPISVEFSYSANLQTEPLQKGVFV